MDNTTSTAVIAAALCLLLFGGSAIGIASESTSKPLTDFSDASAGRRWISVNDDVMGGVSEGAFRITDADTLVFSGNLSLENRGGFASIRTRPAALNLDGYDRIALRLKGDGRTYYVNMMTSSRNASSYRAPIETEEGVWKEVRVGLEDFVYTSYGRIIAGAAPLKAGDVRSIGITLADKKAGPFRLEVDWIRAEKGAGDQEAATASGKDIVDTAIAAGNFNTLVAAVKAAGLVEALKSEGPLTVFAPNDEAFAKLPAGTVEELLKPENRDRLVAVLSYHVVSGEILLAARSPQTLEGRSLAIRTSGPFEVNGANVIASDIAASNGVIHAIDTVLLPPEEKRTPKEAAREIIELAIERGVPLFNAGQPSACAAIYEVAVDSLLKSHSDALAGQDRSILRDALRKVRSDDQNSTEQAWTLRRALDAVYRSLGSD